AIITPSRKEFEGKEVCTIAIEISPSDSASLFALFLDAGVTSHAVITSNAIRKRKKRKLCLLLFLIAYRKIFLTTS
ncbi:MAG: hypothetical protein D3916_09000, partial [Candidatus Electrothrix sp. MAN1_4]|nr:hypothetical protein [Candidatus Electrothrix sp. MAN1_4]